MLLVHGGRGNVQRFLERELTPTKRLRVRTIVRRGIRAKTSSVDACQRSPRAICALGLRPPAGEVPLARADPVSAGVSMHARHRFGGRYPRNLRESVAMLLEEAMILPPLFLVRTTHVLPLDVAPLAGRTK